jgi:hypothetical protein
MPRKHGNARNVVLEGFKPGSHWDRYMAIKKLADKVAPPIGGSPDIGAVIVKHLAADGADVASVFVTNGGYNCVQQVLILRRPHGRSRIRPNSD